jgi:hypothetical protein
MNLIIADVVARFRRNWTDSLAPQQIEQLCREMKLTWRDRLLGPVRTVQLMLLQVLLGNTALSHLPHLSDKQFSAAALCKAKQRLPLKFFEALLERITDRLQQEDFRAQRWNGHRVFIADGSSVSMPDDKKLVEAFGYPSRQRQGCGFPVAKPVFMLHMGSGMIVEAVVNPFRSHEISHINKLHPLLRSGDVLVADRAFCSYHHFCSILQAGLHAVIRMHQHLIADFTPGRSYYPPRHFPHRLKRPKSRQIQLLGTKDQLIEWFKPSSKPSWMSHEEFNALPPSITVRQLEYRVHQPGFRSSSIVLMTTLIDSARYPASDLAQLYHRRWDIEVNFDHLKTTMKMDILKCRTVDGIKKELLCYLIVYNLVRLVMLEAAYAQRVAPRRISFIDALRWLLHASPGDKLPPLALVPLRPNRLEPRTKKRREKGYPYMCLPRPELRKRKLSQCLGA